MDLLFCLPALVFMGLGIYSVFKPSKGVKTKAVNIENEDKNIEDLQKMQNYRFWRDFGE